MSFWLSYRFPLVQLGPEPRGCHASDLAKLKDMTSMMATAVSWDLGEHGSCFAHATPLKYCVSHSNVEADGELQDVEERAGIAAAVRALRQEVYALRDELSTRLDPVSNRVRGMTSVSRASRGH
jgi:hypothetical protein